MRRLLSMLLCVCLCAGLLTGVTLPASAEDFGDTEENFRRAIAETALAYYRKGAGVQYDSVALTFALKHKDGGLCRITSETPPEHASADNPLYTVCSDFCYSVYYDAFGYKLTGQASRCVTNHLCDTPLTDPITVYKWDVAAPDQCTTRGLTRDEAIRDGERYLQSGDVVVGFRKSNSGHAMLYLGDYEGTGTKWFIHAGTGDKINITTGEDYVEPGGTVILNSSENGPFHAGGAYDLSSEKRNIVRFIILRPMNELKKSGHLTPAAKARLRYPGIAVDRSASLRKYRTATVGEAVTVKVAITNNSTKPYSNLHITEALPLGGVIRKASVSDGGRLTETGIRWENVTVPAGETKVFTYDVVISGLPGETLTLPGGTVDTLTTRAMSYPIGGKVLNAEKQAALAGVADMDKKEAAAYKSCAAKPVSFVNALYQNELGIPLHLPESIGDYVTGLLRKSSVKYVNNDGSGSVYSAENAKGFLWAPKKTLSEPWKSLSKMILPEHLVGRMVDTEDRTVTTRLVFNAVGRVLVFDEANYEPGDIFLGLNGSKAPDLTAKDADALVYVYLGGGKVATVDAESGLTVEPFSATVELALRQRLLIALRPSLTYADVNTGATVAVSGTCGTHASFLRSSDGHLLIYGAGAVTAAPWMAPVLLDVTVAGDITALPECAFAGASDVTETTLAKTVTTVGADACGDCTALATVNYGGTMAEWNAMTVGAGNAPLRNAAAFHYDKCGGRHTWDSGVKTEATATSKGCTTYTCTVCGATEQRDFCYPAGTKVIVALPDGREGYFSTLDQTVIAFAADKTICPSINAATVTLLDNISITDDGTILTADALHDRLRALGSGLTPEAADDGINSAASYMVVPKQTKFIPYKTTQDGAVIVDLNGHTLTYKGSRNLFQTGRWGLTVKNGTVIYTGSSDNSHGFYVSGSTKETSANGSGEKWIPILNVENAKVYCTGGGPAITTYVWYAQVELRNSTVLSNGSKGLSILKSSKTTFKDNYQNPPYSPAIALHNSTLGSVGGFAYSGSNSTYPAEDGQWITVDSGSRLVYKGAVSDKAYLALQPDTIVQESTFTDYFPGGITGTRVQRFERGGDS